MTYLANVQRTIQEHEQEGERRGMRKGLRKGLRKSIAKQRDQLCRQAAKKFDDKNNPLNRFDYDDTSEQLKTLLEAVDDPDILDQVAEYLIDCDSGSMFISQCRRFGPPEQEQEPTYMTSVQRSIQEREQKGEQRGERRGMAKGRRDQLCRMAAKKFNDCTSKQLKTLLKTIDDPDVLDQVAEDIIDCDTAKELINACKRLGSS